MTTNWIEEIRNKFHDIHEAWKKQGYVFDLEQGMIDHITTLLEKQSEEYVEMIGKLKISSSKIIELNEDYQEGHDKAIDNIINLIKSHDNV